MESDWPGRVVLYLRFVDQTDGDCPWQGAVHMTTGAVWDADIYGGPPYEVDSHTSEVQSE